MLSSSGGYGEVAIQMASICRAKRTDFRVIVPDTAASAATLLALSADQVVMSSPSTLGPIDPQIYMPQRHGFLAAKQILEVVDDLERRAQANPDALALYGALLADIDAVAYQTAKAAIESTNEDVATILEFRRDPSTPQEVSELAENLQSHAVHSTVIGYAKAIKLGIPTVYMDPVSEQWNRLWELHTMYVAECGPNSYDVINIIEGHRVSFIYDPPQSQFEDVEDSE